MGAMVDTMGTTGATEDTMAATVITPGEDAVAMVMAATDTTAAKRQQDGNNKGKQWRIKFVAAQNKEFARNYFHKY